MKYLQRNKQMTKKSSKIEWEDHSIQITKDNGTYIISMLNGIVEEQLSIVLALGEYFELLELLEQAK